MAGEPTILHADLDAFYASVEQLLDPSLRGRPMAVGGGVILAASYEARAYGVRGAMSAVVARRLCPGLVIVGGHFGEYVRLSKLVMQAFADVTPLVEQISIDEAFLDVSGARRLFGAPSAIAARLRLRIRHELGLPLSIGVASTKHLAKIASQVAKPDGLVVVAVGSERQFLDPLPVELVWGVGPVTRATLHERGITTIGQLAAQQPGVVASILGRGAGGLLQARANNVDARSVNRARRAGSVGAQSAFGRRPMDPEQVRAVLGHLADRVGRRMRAGHLAARTLTVRIRRASMASITRSVTFNAPVAETLTIAEAAELLVLGAVDCGEEISLLGLSMSKLVRQAAVQLSLSEASGGDRWAVDQAMDGVRQRFGVAAVGYWSTIGAERGAVPDAFRELAEHDPS